MHHRFQKYSMLPPELNEAELYDFISKSADLHEPAMSYDRPLTAEEISEKSIAFVQASSSYAALEAEIKGKIKELNSELKAEKSIIDKRREEIEKASEDIVEPGFGFKNMDSGEFIFVNPTGHIIGIRALTPEERQLSAFGEKVQESRKTAGRGKKGTLTIMPDVQIEEGDNPFPPAD